MPNERGKLYTKVHCCTGCTYTQPQQQPAQQPQCVAMQPGLQQCSHAPLRTRQLCSLCSRRLWDECRDPRRITWEQLGTCRGLQIPARAVCRYAVGCFASVSETWATDSRNSCVVMLHANTSCGNGAVPSSDRQVLAVCRHARALHAAV